MNHRLALAAIVVVALSACGSDIQSESPENSETATSTLPETTPPSPDTEAPPATSSSTTAAPAPETSPPGTGTETAPASSSSTAPSTSVDEEVVATDVPADVTDGLRLDDGAAIYGAAVLSEIGVQATIDSISEDLGVPSSTTGWMPMPEPLSSLGVLEYSEVWWSDLRVVFERTDGVERLSSWSLGVLPVDGCFPPPSSEPTGASMLTTSDGIGIGSTVDAVADHYFLVNQTSAAATIANVNPIAISLDNERVTGVSQARADCFADDDL